MKQRLQHKNERWGGVIVCEDAYNAFIFFYWPEAAIFIFNSGFAINAIHDFHHPRLDHDWYFMIPFLLYKLVVPKSTT